MKNQKRQFTAEFKVQELTEHLENQEPVGKICELYNIHPNLFYLWKKELFSGALETFSKNLILLIKHNQKKLKKLHRQILTTTLTNLQTSDKSV